MSLGEIVLLLIVGIIVVGPRNLPTMMRTAGQWIARLRRLTSDLRAQSGIDDVLRREGLDEHIHELRSLSRLSMVESLIAPAAAAGASQAAAADPYLPPPGTTLTSRAAPSAEPPRETRAPLREREYPVIGCDAYGALPDDVISSRNMGKANAESESTRGAGASVEPAAEGHETRPESAPAEPVVSGSSSGGGEATS